MVITLVLLLILTMYFGWLLASALELLSAWLEELSSTSELLASLELVSLDDWELLAPWEDKIWLLSPSLLVDVADGSVTFWLEHPDKIRLKVNNKAKQSTPICLTRERDGAI